MELTEKSKLEEKPSVEKNETECVQCQGLRKRFIGYFVTMVILVIFILTAVAASLVIYERSVKQYLERSLASSNNGKEPMVIVVRSVDGEGGMNSFIADSSSKIATVRLPVSGNGFVCFAYPNEEGTEEFELFDPKLFNMTSINSGLCSLGKVPVPKAGSLNEEAKKLCRGWPLYWAEKSCLIVQAENKE